MANIRPISDLRNRADEISSLCHDTGEPVYITKNGREDLVVMSQAAFDRQQARLELYALLDETAAGPAKITHDEVMARLRKIIG